MIPTITLTILSFLPQCASVPNSFKGVCAMAGSLWRVYAEVIDCSVLGGTGDRGWGNIRDCRPVKYCEDGNVNTTWCAEHVKGKILTTWWLREERQP